MSKCYCYMDYSNSNYGANSMAFEDPKGNVFYYSYRTLIGFYSATMKKSYFLNNMWGPTTGKHMNQLSRKEDRLDQSAFLAMQELAFGEKEVKLYQEAESR